MTATADAASVDVSGVMCDGTGTVLVTFGITDPCGNTYADEDCIMTVNPAPNPSFVCPTIAAVDCDDAFSFTIANVSDQVFDNGLTGDCEVTAIARAIDVDVSNVTCDGTGAIVVTFEITDDCGNTYNNETCMVPVNPAPQPVFDCNLVPSSITCTDASDITTLPVLTFDNGALGACKITATATPVLIISNTADCDGNGDITVRYEITDDCGFHVYADEICTIPVGPAPQPIFACPTLTPIDCDAALALTIADIADVVFDNGLTGGCLVTATATATAIDASNVVCDGTGDVIVTFDITDDCGNAVYQETCSIPINPAPAPVLTCPVYPSMDCDAALALTTADIADIVFDNGLTGVCLATATATATAIDVSNVVCDGTGDVIVTFDITDDCGNALYQETCSIPLNPVPAPVFTCPVYPSMDCDVALALTPADVADIVFNNGLTGSCLATATATATAIDVSNVVCDGIGDVLSLIHI